MRAGDSLIQKLGKNVGRYHGERIDIDHVRREVDRLASDRGWQADTFLESPPLTLRAYRRPHASSRKNLYLSTGIHGDEPSGPLAVLRLLASGKRLRDIASYLGLGEETVRSHLKKAQSKLGVSDRTHAVAQALRLHLIA